MIRIYRAYNVVQAHIVKDLLNLKGVEAEVFYDHVGGPGLGPYMQAGVWLMDEHDRDFAQRMIEEHEARIRGEVDNGEPVNCQNCKEQNPASFEICWSCGEDIPRSADAELSV